MTENKSKLQAQLLEQMRALRSQIDPDVLDRARVMAQKHQQKQMASRAQPASRQPQAASRSLAGTVPYDKTSARDVVKRYLENHDDPEAVREKLEAYIRMNLADK